MSSSNDGLAHDTVRTLGVVELNVENRGTLAVSVARKRVSFVAPDRRDVYPVSAVGVANILGYHPPVNPTGINSLDAVQLLLGFVTLAHNYKVAAKWDHLMPETFGIAAGEKQRMLLVFPTRPFTPGLWRLELPFNTDSGTASPQMSVPLVFKATQAAPDVPKPGELGRVEEALTLIRWEYIHPIEDEKLVTACRERMLKQSGQPLDSSEQTHTVSSTPKPALEEIIQTFTRSSGSMRARSKTRRL